MDVLVLLDKLDDLIYNSKPIPLTDQVRVDREEVYALLDQIRVTLPEEIKQARWIVKERRELHEAEPEDQRIQALAESIDELKRSQRPAPPPLTSAAAEKVRSVIEAAEASGAEVRAEAEREARRIEEEAARRGVEVRKRSAEEAAARLKRADDVTRTLLDEAGNASANLEQLLDRVRGPAAALADVLGDHATALQADFDRMRATVAETEEEERTSRAAPPGRPDAAPAAAPEPVAQSHEVQDEAGWDPQPQAEDDLSQPTEEWSYEEMAYAEHGYAEDGYGDAGDQAVDPSLPGPHSHVSAERLEPVEDQEPYDQAPGPVAPRRGHPR